MPLNHDRDRTVWVHNMVPLLPEDAAEIQTAQGLRGESGGHEERQRERKALCTDYGHFGRDRLRKN